MNVNDLLDELIEQSVALVGKPVALMNKDDKVKRHPASSASSGAFLVTKSGDKVAKYFGISKYTLYSYIDAQNNSGGKASMSKIDLTINKAGLEHNIQKAKENNIIIPTIAQMQNPETDPREDPGQAQERRACGM